MLVRCNSWLAVGFVFEVRIDVEAYTSAQDVDAPNRVRGEVESTVPALREDTERQSDLKPSSEFRPYSLFRWKARQEEMHQFVRARRCFCFDSQEPPAPCVGRPGTTRIASTMK